MGAIDNANASFVLYALPVRGGGCPMGRSGREFRVVTESGGLAQLGERLNGIQEVGSSTLLPSTNLWFVYILQSRSTGRFYVGSTNHLLRRFRQHQAGCSSATRHRGPWWMPYYEIHDSLSAARAREAELKRKKSAESLRRVVHGVQPGLEGP